MGQPYFDLLTAEFHHLSAPRGVTVECKHFFSGAALYANGKIFASLTPAGLAIKLPETSRAALRRDRRGGPLRYFKGGPIKKEYVVLSPGTASDAKAVREFLLAGVSYVTGLEWQTIE